jgi:site-specific DNA recombinase
MLIAIYCRVSTDEQAADGYSLAAQERAGRLYAELHGHTVYQSYIDDGYSGTSEIRPALRRLLHDAAIGRFQSVVVHKLDRWARNTELLLRTVRQLDQGGIAFISVSEQLDFSTPAGKMLLTVLAGMGQFHSDNLATEVRKGLQEKARQGGWVGPVPLGYRKNEAGALVPSDDAQAVQLAFGLYASGNHSYTSLAEELNARGHTIIDIHTGQRRPFGREGVRGLLHNTAYIGMVQCSDVEYQGIHQPLVTYDLWERARAVRERRTQQDGGRVFTRGNGGLLTEIAYCGRCGARLHWHISGRTRTPFYRCGRRAGYGKSACDAAMINAGQIEERVRELLRLLTIPPHVRDAVLLEVQRRLSAPATTPQQADHERVRRQLQRLKAAYLAGDEELSDEVYFRERDRLSRLLGASTPAPRQTLDVQAALALLGDMPALLATATMEQQRAIVQQVFQQLWIEKPLIKAIASTGTFAMLVEAMAENNERRAMPADEAVDGGCPTGFEISPSTVIIPPRWTAFNAPYVSP